MDGACLIAEDSFRKPGVTSKREKNYTHTHTRAHTYIYDSQNQLVKANKILSFMIFLKLWQFSIIKKLATQVVALSGRGDARIISSCTE